MGYLLRTRQCNNAKHYSSKAMCFSRACVRNKRRSGSEKSWSTSACV